MILKTQENETKKKGERSGPRENGNFFCPESNFRVGEAQVLAGKQDCGNRGYKLPAPRTLNSQLPLLFSCLFLFSPFLIANCNEHLKVISRYSSHFPRV